MGLSGRIKGWYVAFLFFKVLHLYARPLLTKATVWLTQAQMAELFQTDRTSIVKHVNNIYKSEELVKDSTCAKIAHVQIEDISHCFSCSDAASLTLIEAIFFCLSLILRCLLLPAYHNTPASEHKPDSDEY